MAFKVKSPFKSATSDLADALRGASNSMIGVGDKASLQLRSPTQKTYKKAWRQTKGNWKNTRGKAAEGSIWGDSAYARYASNIAGITTTARAGKRSQDTIEGGQNPDFEGYKDDFRSMRPSHGYSAAKHHDEDKVIAEAQRQQGEVDARYAEQKRLQAKFDAGQVASRVRRSRRSDRPGTKGGTIKTSGLGSTGGATSFAQLLGL